MNWVCRGFGIVEVSGDTCPQRRLAMGDVQGGFGGRCH